MTAISELNTEEYAARVLADIALQLYKRGFIEPYIQIIKARNMLLSLMENPNVGNPSHRREECVRTAIGG